MVKGTLGVVGDAQPYIPEEEQVKVAVDPLQEEMSKLGNNKAKWAQITDFIHQRHTYYRNFLPGVGTAADTALNKMDHAERGMWWLCAATMIAEYQAFEDVINEVADAKRRQPPEVLPS
jgi:hypothetical protein